MQYENNDLVRSVENLYYATYRPQLDKVEYNKKWFWIFKKKHTMLVNRKKLARMQKCADIADYLNNISDWDFDTFMEFATFVKIVEKIFGYKNDSNSLVVCDSKLSDKSKVLVFRFYAGNIAICLGYRDEVEVIKISIQRETGRKMYYGYEIIDGEVTGKLNNSDEVSLDTIIDFVADMMSGFYIYICNAIISKSISFIFMDELPFDAGDFGIDNEIDFGFEDLDEEDLEYIAKNNPYTFNEDTDIYYNGSKSLGDFEKCRLIHS